MSEHKDTREFPTDAGTSDGIVGDGETMAGHGGAGAQAEANEFYDELGAIIEGKEGDEVHHPDTGDVPVDTRPIETDAGTSDGIVGDGEKMTGHGGPEAQEGANEFYEELGAIIEGKEGDNVHHPDME